MASVVLSSSVVVGHQSLVTNGAYTSYDLTRSGSFPAAGYRITGAVLRCTLRNARWDTITVKAADGTTLGTFGAVGSNGERTCTLTTGYNYAGLTHITLYGGGVGTQIASGSFVTIEVSWEYTTSQLTLSATSVDAGGTVTATIKAYDGGFSHRVTLAFGSRSQSWDVAAGTAAQGVTVPLDWLDQIPNAVSGMGTVTLYTLSGGNTIGQVSASLTIRAPQSVAPTFTASCAPLLTVGGVTYPSMGSGVYVQTRSGCTARITGAAAQYGATVKGYSIRGGGYSGTNATLATGLLGTSGTIPFVFRVTDSRGLYTEKTVNISVLAYTPPQVSSLTGWRVNSAGSTAPTGTLGKCRAIWSYTSLGGANTCTVKAFIKPTGGSETALNAAMASGVDYWVATAAGNMTLTVTTRYILRLALTDKYGTVSVTADLPSAAFAMHLNAAGNSIAFGKACEKTNAVEIAAGRTLYLGDSTLAAYIQAQAKTTTVRDWIRNTFFPVGAIYQSYAATSPASLFGGTWTKIVDRFLVGAGQGYTAGAAGGAVTVALQKTNLPAIQVTPVRSGDRFMSVDDQAALKGPDGWITPSSSGTVPIYWGTNWGTAILGDGTAHENRPPYFAVYIWRRTA